tara:strand:+ start:520 stop:1269 length:750 start_codon:yes stop_codon:yes gene_type:complete
MKSVICHFYNEEYLLPWWLNHHKKYFDYGLMINYKSTDRSVEIINEICPDWQVVDSVNPEFSAAKVDSEIMYYEEQIPGWKIVLNTTEFLVGKYSLLIEEKSPKEIYIPSFYFVDESDNTVVESNIPLYEQLFNGIDFVDNPMIRKLRCLHNHQIKYVPGRHFSNFDDITNDFVIFNYGFSPMNADLISRKLQIQHRMPESDKKKNWGWEHHDNNKGLTEEKLYDTLNTVYRPQSKDLSDKMKKYLEMK